MRAALERGAHLRRPAWGLGDVAILWLGAIIVPVVLVSFLLAGGLQLRSATGLVVLGAVPWIVLVGWPVLTTRLQGNGFRIDLGYAFRWSDVGWGFVGAIGCFAAAYPVQRLTEHFFGPFSSAAGDAATESGAPRWVLVLFAVMVVVGAPLAEEMAFRGLVFSAVAKHVAGRGRSRNRVLSWSTVVSAALFAAIHLEPVRFPLLFAIGLVLGALRASTGRVGASVMAHAFNNLLPGIGLALLGT